MGYESNAKYKSNNIKEMIIAMLARSKKGTDPEWSELTTIRSNLDKMDHHDYVRIDQILTRKANKKESEYQWGSIVMNCKWKTL